MSEDELVPFDLTGPPTYLVEWPAGLPHAPMWNLIPRHQNVPWECSWHGTVAMLRCEACHAEHAEYRKTGTWEPKSNSHQDAAIAASAVVEAISPRRADELAGWLNKAAAAGVLPEFTFGDQIARLARSILREPQAGRIEISYLAGEAGVITPEIVSDVINALWSPPPARPPLARRPAPSLPADPFTCGVQLFALPAAVSVVAATYSMYLAWEAAGRPPVQGPQPAVCAREPHPGSPWHNDGRGTWWKDSGRPAGAERKP